jgi:hypothetical protein
MMKSAAWQSLSATGRAIYIEMAARYAGIGTNNGRIPYSVRDAAEALKIGKSTAARELEALQDRGFIVATRKGAFSLKTDRHSTEWRLTEFPSDVCPTLSTKAFMSWTPEKQNTVPVVGRVVPLQVPCGPATGTDDAKMSRYGT